MAGDAHASLATFLPKNPCSPESLSLCLMSHVPHSRQPSSDEQRVAKDYRQTNTQKLINQSKFDECQRICKRSATSVLKYVICPIMANYRTFFLPDTWGGLGLVFVAKAPPQAAQGRYFYCQFKSYVNGLLPAQI